jgi:undecaprenyl-diphosphatase
MNIIEALILGMVQGITEWFPISSSGHLVLIQQAFTINASVAFDIFLHLGSLLVLLIFFRKEILGMLRSFVFMKTKTPEFKLGIFIVIGTVPAAVVGIFFSSFLEALFTSVLAVGIAFLITGTILYTTKYARQNKSITPYNSFLIGIGQAVALVPGISRSASTISTGMLAGVKKEEAARFSFLLGIPAIIGAAVFELSKISLRVTDIPIYTAGIIASFAIGYVTLSLLLKIITKGKFHYFSWYCWIVGIISIILYLAGV